jgi:hypothetical protein
MTDREVIEWAANAQVGDKLPDEFCNVLGPMTDFSRGMDRMVRRLVEAGVMPEPAIGVSRSAVALQATAASREWLATHPE